MNRLVLGSIFIALIIAGRVAAQQQAQSGVRARAITGRVLDHNGQPLAGGKVHIGKMGAPGNSLNASTNDLGEFRFDDLSPGIYMLYVHGAMDDDQLQKIYRPGDFAAFRMKKGGVITGTVTNSAGEPMIVTRVQVTRVRDQQGRRIDLAGFSNDWREERFTDDRGVYRFWGLAPGSYLVRTEGRGPRLSNRSSSVPDGDAPATYHPSAARLDSATEVSVDEGREATGIDIRCHNETGHAISGHISGQAAGGSNESGTGIRLTHASTGVLVAWQGVRAADGSNNFVFEGLADGEYDLTALHVSGRTEIDAASSVSRVVVKGQDVTGVEIKLSPLGSIEGRVVLEAGHKPRCQGRGIMRPDETAIIVSRERADPPLPIITFRPPGGRGAMVVPDEKGVFTIRSLQAERYRIETQLPSEDWYIRSISLPGPASPSLPDAGRDGIAVKPGERVTGVTITAQEGAASLRGRVVTAQEGAVSQARIRVHLVPAEPEQSNHVLRFAEAAVQSDGSFILTNIAPGRYWLLARPSDDVREDSIRPAAWDREARAMLTREASSANNSLELQPCQRINDHVLRYAPPGTTGPKNMQ